MLSGRSFLQLISQNLLEQFTLHTEYYMFSSKIKLCSFDISQQMQSQITVQDKQA